MMADPVSPRFVNPASETPEPEVGEVFTWEKALRWVCALLMLLVGVMFLTGSFRGCYAVEADGSSELDIRFAAWVWMLGFTICIGVAAAGASMLRSRRKRGAGIVLLIVSILAGLGIMPNVVIDHLHVDSQRLRQETGFWFSPTVRTIPLADVEAIYIEGSVASRKSRWTIRLNNGAVLEVDPGDLWESNELHVVQFLRDRGVNVVRL